MMRAILRRFSYVRQLEAELESTRKELASEQAVGKARDRYIDTLEGLREHHLRVIASLENRRLGGRP
jgi:hypothetical protein